MKHHLFRKYVWLIDTIRQNKGISFEEIADLWLGSPFNPEKSPLALRTFHNHRNAIENLFGIRIVCNRSNRNSYHIDGYPDNNDTRLKVWMVTTLGSTLPQREPAGITGRILHDHTSVSTLKLDPIVEAINSSLLIRIISAVPTRDGKTSILLAPYALAQWCNHWYVFGKDSATGLFHALDLNRVADVAVSDTSFEYPADFNPQEYLTPFFGMDVVPDSSPKLVRLRIKGRTLNEVRTRPLHVSQKEVVTNQDYSVFEYNLVPSEKFIAVILSHGTDTEVMHPESLRKSMADTIATLAKRYL